MLHTHLPIKTKDLAADIEKNLHYTEQNLQFRI